jgi:hypothetical protein
MSYVPKENQVKESIVPIGRGVLDITRATSELTELTDLEGV